MSKIKLFTLNQIEGMQNRVNKAGADNMDRGVCNSEMAYKHNPQSAQLILK
jgi:hypothetical protein